MVGCASERTLTSGLLACAFAHAHIVESIAFNDVGRLPAAAGCFASVVTDFYVRQQNKGHLLPALLKSIPLPELTSLQRRALVVRTLSLNCLTVWYKALWEELWSSDFASERWATTDTRINPSFFARLTPQWQRSVALRTDLERRQALVEIDVITAQAFGLTLEELLTSYRLGFQIMKAYDEDTWYDQTGRIIFTPNSLGLRGVGMGRKASPKDPEKWAVNGVAKPRGLGFEDVKELPAGSTVTRTFIDTTMKGNPERTITYKAPFFRKNREADYAEAWAVFEKRFAEKDA